MAAGVHDDLLAQARGWALATPPHGDAPDPTRIRRAVNLNVIPLLFVLAFLCLLDRSNLSFASLQMDADLGFSRAQYGLGSSLFFIGYLAQLPAAAACVALGARRWLALILLAWGAMAACCAAIQNEASFLVLRLLLGLAEAGTFPGVFHCLGCFFTPRQIGAAYTWVTTSTALAGLLGGPLAAAFMSLDGKLMAGWRWLFLLEGALPVMFSAVLWWRLPAGPLTAKFLTPAEQQWLWQHIRGGGEVELGGRQFQQQQPLVQPLQPQLSQQRFDPGLSAENSRMQPSRVLGSKASTSAAAGAAAHDMETASLCGPEEQFISGKGSDPMIVGGLPDDGGGAAPSPSAAAASAGGGLSWGTLRAGACDLRVLHLGLVMAAIEFCMTSTHFWVPQLVRAALRGELEDDSAADDGAGSSPGLAEVVHVSLLSAIPFSVAAVAMVANAHHSKRRNERLWHTAVPLAVACAAFLLLPLAARGEHGPVWALVALSAAASGIWSTHGPWFSFPAAIMERRSATIGFAAVKTLGAVGSFLGPLLVGLLADREHGFGGAMVLLAGVSGVASLLALAFRAGEPAAAYQELRTHDTR